MIAGISGAKARGGAIPTGGLQDAERSQTAAPSRRDTDRYVPGSGGPSAGDAERPVKRLTEDMARSLAERYDVRHMTRNEYGSLLKELRGLGAISAKDFSVGFGGAVPYTPPDGVEMTMGPVERTSLGAWPSGRERADFLELLRSGAGYCAGFASEQEEGSDEEELGASLSASYRRLADVLEQIDRYRT